MEDVIDPDLEITHSHHHLREQHERCYLLDERLADSADGHRVTTTIFAEVGSATTLASRRPSHRSARFDASPR
jgi:hypothetical protein